MSSLLTEIKHKSLVERIVEAVENRILSGDLKPGERLMEAPLSKSLNVSRASVREALFILESRGFVESVPRKGFSVTKLSAEKVKDIYQIRAALESLAMYLAIEKQDPEVISKLRETTAAMQKYAEANDPTRCRLMDIQFHEIIYEASGNEKLMALLNNFNKQIMRYREEYFRTPLRPMRSVDIHTRLLAYFEQNEPTKAAKFREESLYNNMKILIQAIAEHEKESKQSSEDGGDDQE